MPPETQLLSLTNIPQTPHHVSLLRPQIHMRPHSAAEDRLRPRRYFRTHYWTRWNFWNGPTLSWLRSRRIRFFFGIRGRIKSVIGGFGVRLHACIRGLGRRMGWWGGWGLALNAAWGCGWEGFVMSCFLCVARYSFLISSLLPFFHELIHDICVFDKENVY